MVKAFCDAHGVSRFPVNVEAIAKDYSKAVFPDEPITLVQGKAFGPKFEGALMRKPGSAEWGIFFNSAISSPGRKNFTLAHELGHYLLHRFRSAEDIVCQRSDMWAWDSEYGVMEAEANQFASFLLMPRDDFDAQTTNFRRPQISDFEAISERYDVSITAAILKWLELTTRRAMIVISRDGFVDWARSSKPLLRSGVYLKARQTTVELPAGALAVSATAGGHHDGVALPSGVWAREEEVFESVLLSEYHGETISLLIYPRTPPPFVRHEED